jgi:23S rRNA (uracil747-C5)-methyltransferase
MIENCSYFKNNLCSSCTLLDLDYLTSVKKKSDEFSEKLLQKNNNIRFHQITSLSRPFASRYKVKLSASTSVNGLEFGIYSSEVKFQELEKCPLHHPFLNKVIAHCKEILELSGIESYDINSRQGELKNCILRLTYDQKHLLIRFVVAHKNNLRKWQNIANKLSKIFNLSLTITLNIQDIPHAILEGEEEIILNGDEYFIDTYTSINQYFHSKSFSQVTPEIASALYEHFRSTIKKHSINSLIDLYCGVGSFSLSANDILNNVIGVEISNNSINAANKTADYLNLANRYKFIAADSLDGIKDLNANNYSILVNPPRRGLSSELIKSIELYNPPYLIYSSCSTQTFLRDYSLLSNSFNLVEIKPFDMFPFTNHMEIFGLFQLR